MSNVKKNDIPDISNHIFPPDDQDDQDLVEAINESLSVEDIEYINSLISSNG